MSDARLTQNGGSGRPREHAEGSRKGRSLTPLSSSGYRSPQENENDTAGPERVVAEEHRRSRLGGLPAGSGNAALYPWCHPPVGNRHNTRPFSKAANGGGRRSNASSRHSPRESLARIVDRQTTTGRLVVCSSQLPGSCLRRQ
ncbi:hypothetical protein SNOG_09343 [Parastagonospora nodorum SN15]|uniref:Uncharacterized protein n=1 Tax=Phaeosphaeria nodorum (strain SN15 / ATCC MYA-4574 / FGSC 10173) TaxID=321614 RepID=Q0UFX1_PHANO|nr:hypothetical protein SNOG_09343 [Parastagonospora nodorum SN15]EAT83535.1 hypothetical protein SNOG_09343 [Parastagonospora nodorum SN15]